jgi:hypothetical protein
MVRMWQRLADGTVRGGELVATRAFGDSGPPTGLRLWLLFGPELNKCHAQDGNLTTILFRKMLRHPERR